MFWGEATAALWVNSAIKASGIIVERGTEKMVITGAAMRGFCILDTRSKVRSSLRRLFTSGNPYHGNRVFARRPVFTVLPG